MKRILVFIGLKVAEIGGVVFVPYWVGKLVIYIYNKVSPDNWIGMRSCLEVYGTGFFSILIFIGICSMIAVFCLIIGQNWEWASKITKRR